MREKMNPLRESDMKVMLSLEVKDERKEGRREPREEGRRSKK